MDHNNPHNLPADESLDVRIRESLSLESDALSLARLERHWRVESQRHTRRRLARRAIPLAAAALLAGIFFLIPQADQREEISVIEPVLEPSIPNHSTDNLSAGRPPTAYERILFAAATRIQEPPAQLPPALPSPAIAREATVDRLTDELVANVQSVGGIELVRQTLDEETRYSLMQRLLTAKSRSALVAYLSIVHDKTLRAEALVAGAEMKELPVEGFIELLGHDNESVRLAAAMVLGRMNRCEMTTALIDRVQQQPSDSTEAWFALFACRCEAADTFLVHATQSPKLLGQLNHARLQWMQLSY